MERDRQEDKQNLENDLNGLNLNRNIKNTVQNWIQEFLSQLAERLEKMEQVLVVDRIEGQIAVCENRKNGKMQEINTADLPKDIKEGTVLKWRDGKYEIDTSNQIEDRIEQKMKQVWKD